MSNHLVLSGYGIHKSKRLSRFETVPVVKRISPTEVKKKKLRDFPRSLVMDVFRWFGTHTHSLCCMWVKIQKIRVKKKVMVDDKACIDKRHS